ncbi:MAG: YfiR family protein [Burkholderiales bacterium]
MALLGVGSRQPGDRRRTRVAWVAGAVACVLACLLAAISPASSVFAAEQSRALEQQVKAAFLFRFGSYVEWPQQTFADAESPWTIGVVDSDGLSDELLRVTANRTVNGRPVAVRRIRGGEVPSNVQVLFIGQSAAGQSAELLRQTQKRPILTVTESDAGLTEGSVINFVVVDKRVRFEVSLEAAERNRLKIAAPLLSVALRVRDKGQ